MPNESLAGLRVATEGDMYGYAGFEPFEDGRPVLFARILVDGMKADFFVDANCVGITILELDDDDTYITSDFGLALWVRAEETIDHLLELGFELDPAFGDPDPLPGNLMDDEGNLR